MLSFKQHGVAGRAGAMRDIAPSTLPHVFPRQSRRRPTPRFYTTSAGDVTTVETFISAAAKLRPTARTRRRYIAARANLALYI